MSMRSRITLGAAVTVAFLCGLVFASGFNLTKLSWAQVARPEFASAKLTLPEQTKTAEAVSDAFEWVANTVTPAVVSIQAETEPKRTAGRSPGNMPPGLEQFFHQFQQPNNMPQESSGTGFIVSSDGYILTNNHVVADNGNLADKLTVTLLDHRSFTARVIGRDSTTDVALIKIDAHNLPTVAMGEDSSAHVGQWVLAIGNPLGLNFTVTSGIVSAKGRQLRGLLNPNNQNPYAISDYIQTDAAINPGNSGGPLVNLQGQVIGINSALASGTGYFSGYGFAIPISLARKVMDDLIKYGHVRRAVLGVSIGDVGPADAKVAGMTDIHGAVVAGFTTDNGPSPAETAGIQQSDVIVSVDGQYVKDVAALQRMIRNYEPGQTVNLGIMRYGKSLTIPVKLGSPPSNPTATVASNDHGDNGSSPNAVAQTALGISVSPIPQSLLQQDTIPAKYRHGVMVTHVSISGPAYPDPASTSVTSGLFANADIIVGELYPKKMDIKNVDDLDKAVKSVKSGDYLQLLVYNWQQGLTRPVNVQVR
jgi:serine protease Do